MFYRKVFMGIGTAVGAILSGVLSFGPNNLHFNGPREIPKPRKRPANHVKFRRRDTFCYETNRDPNSREAQRRQRQGAHHRQLWSHKPGTVQPRHVFGLVP